MANEDIIPKHKVPKDMCKVVMTRFSQTVANYTECLAGFARPIGNLTILHFNLTQKANLFSLFLKILQRFVYVAATSIWKLKDLMNTWKISSKTMSAAKWF